MKNKRSFFIAVILLMGVALTIGYAVLSQTLSIKGTTGIASNSWIIYFDNLLERPGTLTPTTPTTINDKKDRIDFTISLDKPGDNYTFEVDIINDGSIDAMIDTVSLTGIPEELEGIIEWKVNYLNGDQLQKCDELLANTKRRIKVVVNYNKDIDELPEEQELDLQLSVKYVQLDNTVCTTTNPPSSPDPIDPDDGRYTLTIDPNYGIYEGTDEIQTFRMVPGQVYVFGEDPIQEYHTFIGWTSDVEGIFNSETKVVTMGEEDATITAGWTQEGDYAGICYRVGLSTFADFNAAVDNAMITDLPITLVSNGCTIDKRSGKDGVIIGQDSREDDSLSGVEQDYNVIFDLNGHKVESITPIYNFAKFTITDSSKSKNGEIIIPSDIGREPGFIMTNYYGRSKGVQTIFNDVKVTNYSYATIVYANYSSYTLVNGGVYSNYAKGNDGSLVYSSDSENQVLVRNCVLNEYENGTIIWADDGYVEIVDVEINALNNGRGNGNIYLNNGIDNYLIRNVNFNAVFEGGSGYGMWLSPPSDSDVINLENIDFEYTGSVGNTMPLPIYISSGYNKTYNLKNCKFYMDANGGVSFASSVYAQDAGAINFDNVEIDIKYTGGTVYGVYANNLNMTGGHINVDVSNAGTLYCVYGIGSGTIDDVDINCNVSGNVGTFHGIDASNYTFINSTFNSEVNFANYYYLAMINEVRNVDFNVSLANANSVDGLKIYGEFSDVRYNVNLPFASRVIDVNGGTIENMNLTMNVPSTTSNSVTVYNLNNTVLKNSTLTANVKGTGSFTGTYCNGCTLDNVTLNVVSDTEGSDVYGVNGSNVNIKDSTINVEAKKERTIYGINGSGTVEDSTLSIKALGARNPVYGIYGSNLTSNNNVVTLETIGTVLSTKYGYNLSGTSSINGGSLNQIGATIDGSGGAPSVSGINSSGTLSISNYELNSKYSCISFTGDTLTTNGVTMTCGDYGIRKSETSTIDSTDTTINATLGETLG